MLQLYRQIIIYKSILISSNEQHFEARNQTNIIQTQWFFKLREEIV